MTDRVWIPGMREKLRELKQDLQHARQKASGNTFTFMARVDDGDIQCMQCGSIMAEISGQPACFDCGLDVYYVELVTHKVTDQARPDLGPDILS